MVNDNVYYINLKSYTHDLHFDDLVGRFVKSKIGQTIVGESNTIDVTNKLLSELRKIAYTYIEKTHEETEIDQILGKEIMTHLKIFFKQPQSKTVRRKRKPRARSQKMSVSQ